VRGYANKVIARSSGDTEATVKVHMKSILQKIQAANRTQAAGRRSTAILPTKLKAAC
jgi:two-component system nitrate/nitrite response regulator NarL